MLTEGPSLSSERYNSNCLDLTVGHFDQVKLPESPAKPTKPQPASGELPASVHHGSACIYTWCNHGWNLDCMVDWHWYYDTTKNASDIKTLLSKTHFLQSSTVQKQKFNVHNLLDENSGWKDALFDIDPQHLIQQGHPARSWHVDDTVEFETSIYRGETQTTSGLTVVEVQQIQLELKSWHFQCCDPKRCGGVRNIHKLLSFTTAPQLTWTQIAEDFSWRSRGLKQPSHGMNDLNHHDGWRSEAIWSYVRIGFCLDRFSWLKQVKNLCSA